ncbi:hypothetical protein MBANPS3_001838 [Mucor bainieri]
MSTTTTATSLPAEVWIEIFNNINSFQQLMQCSLVCKRWQQCVGSVISIIQEYSESKYVYNSLKSNNEIRRSIKHLAMTAPERFPKYGHYKRLYDAYRYLDLDHLEYFKKLVPLVVNENLETFGGPMEGSAFFEILLTQVESDEGLARFSNLKTIPSAWDYNMAYDRLLYRLKDTLKQVTLYFQFSLVRYQMSQLATLYNLDKLTQLEELSINSFAQTVQQLERILKNCNQLKSLKICLIPSFNGASNVDEWIKSNALQNNTLTTLKVELIGNLNPQFMDYLLYKYCNVTHVYVWQVTGFRPWIVPFLVRPIDIGVIRSILEKIHGIANYTLKCLAGKKEIDNVIKALTADGYSVSGSPDAFVVSNSHADHVKNCNEYYFEADPPRLAIYDS